MKPPPMLLPNLEASPVVVPVGMGVPLGRGRNAFRTSACTVRYPTPPETYGCIWPEPPSGSAAMTLPMKAFDRGLPEKPALFRVLSDGAKSAMPSAPSTPFHSHASCVPKVTFGSLVTFPKLPLLAPTKPAAVQWLRVVPNNLPSVPGGTEAGAADVAVVCAAAACGNAAVSTAANT